jgi:hypothetical protein
MKMMADKKAREEDIYQNSIAERTFMNSKTERKKREREMQADSQKSKKWVEENWNEEHEKNYNAWKKSIEPGRVISIDQGRDKQIKEAL